MALNGSVQRMLIEQTWKELVIEFVEYRLLLNNTYFVQRHVFVKFYKLTYY